MTMQNVDMGAEQLELSRFPHRGINDTTMLASGLTVSCEDEHISMLSSSDFSTRVLLKRN